MANEVIYERPFITKTVINSNDNTITKEKQYTYDVTSDSFAKDYRFGKIVNYITMGEFQFKNRQLAQKRLVSTNVTRDSSGNITNKTPIYLEDDIYRDEKVFVDMVDEKAVNDYQY